MSPIYAELKKCFKAGEFADLRMRPEDGREVSIWSKDGRFLQLFATRDAAQAEQDKQWTKAQKFIQ